MKRFVWLVSSIVLTVLALSLIAPQTAHAKATVERIRYEEEGVNAEWSYTDESGVTTVISIVSAQFPISIGPNEPPTRYLSVTILKFDAEGFPLIMAEGVTETFDLDIHPHLNHTHLSGTVLATDVVPGTGDHPVEIDLTLEATGPLVKTSEQSQTNEGGVTTITKLQGKSREAEATGEVIIYGENFTPMPSTTANAYITKDRSIIITHD